MDVIWKELSDHNPAFNHLRLHCSEDPASSALYVIESNHLHGITYEANFCNDAAYLMDFILPDSQALQTVEIDWSYLSRLPVEDREKLLLSVAQSMNLKELRITGNGADDSSMSLNALSDMLVYAYNLQYLSIELSRINCEDLDAWMSFTEALHRIVKLETIHLSSICFESVESNKDCVIDELIKSLSSLNRLRSIHLSQVHTVIDPNSDNVQELVLPNKVKSPQPDSLLEFGSLRQLENLSLVNMGLGDQHCLVLEDALANHSSITSLVLLDNPEISDNGNQALLRLLEKNRSIYSTIYGLDIDSIFRTNQLKLLHMNRCGRQAMRNDNGADPLDFIEYMTKINEIVPEDFELDAIFSALVENPELVRSYEGEVFAQDSDSVVVNEAMFYDQPQPSTTHYSPHQASNYYYPNAMPYPTPALQHVYEPEQQRFCGNLKMNDTYGTATTFPIDSSMMLSSSMEHDCRSVLSSRQASLYEFEMCLQDKESALVQRKTWLDDAEKELLAKEERLRAAEKKLARSIRKHYGSSQLSIDYGDVKASSSFSSAESFCLPGLFSLDLLGSLFYDKSNATESDRVM